MSILRRTAKAAFVASDLLLRSPKGPRILIYHQVGAGMGRQMEVTRADFLWQLDWLTANKKVVTLEEAVERWNEPGSERLVVLTFDDGYRDMFINAFPVMKERGLPFVLYVATSSIGTESEGVEWLSWAQIEQMMGSDLVTVGAHTHTHRDLRDLDIGEVRKELERANDLLQHRLGVNPRHFAYPWGYWSARAHPIVAEMYDTAALGAPVTTTPFDPHRMFRFPVQLSDGRRWFGARLRGGLLAEELVRRKLRGYSDEG